MDQETPLTYKLDMNRPTIPPQDVPTLPSPLCTVTRKVQFGTVVINEHPIIVGCNPAVSSGVPLSIDWERVSQRVMSIQDYETIRKPVRVEDNSMLLKDSTDRYYMLQSLGYSYKELRDAEKAVDMIRKFRQQSYEEYEYDNYMDSRNDDDAMTPGRNGKSDPRKNMSKSFQQFSANLMIPRRLRVRSVFRVRPVVVTG